VPDNGVDSIHDRDCDRISTKKFLLRRTINLKAYLTATLIEFCKDEKVEAA